MSGGAEPDASRGGSRLAALARLADELGAPTLAAEARAVAERLGEGRFYVVCVGQFKRGKSTLLNALIGEPVLPTGVVPVTSVVTVIRYGEHLAARVRHDSGDWEECEPQALATYVSEEQNPGNQKGIAGVEVFAPSAVLESGLCFVDTPGIGSVSAANTETARAFVPHVDAALIVLGGDPPIAGDELALIEDIARMTSTLVVVLNKADRLPDAERAEALRFTERVLAERLGRPVEPIYQVSATESLSGKGPPRDWDGFAGRLAALARISGADLVRAAERRETAALAERLQREIDERDAALRRPLEDSESRIEVLRRVVAAAGVSLDDLGHRLAGAQARLSQRFAEERNRFFWRARSGALGDLAAAMHDDEASAPALRTRSVELALEIAGRWLDRWRQEQEPRVEALYREVTARFVELVNGFQASLAAMPELAALPLPPLSPGLKARSRLCYAEMLTAAPVSAAARLLDLVAPRALQWRAIERAAGRYLERLLEVNSARVTNDFEARVAESRGELEAELRARLQELVEPAVRALENARHAHTAGAAAIGAELQRLERLRARLSAARVEAA
jgi:GTP-binding protein EngB required for normal cell division